MANDEKESPEKGSPLAGPALVTIHVASPRGPFAREGARLPIAHTHLSVVNTGKVPVELTGLTLDLLQQSKTGTRVESSLTVGAAPQNLAPGESAEVKISGSIPATPGVYTSTLRIAPAQGAPLAIRVEFRVAARAFWGVACMVLGLSLVALINVLDSESGIKGKLHDALLARETERERQQQTPPPHSLAARADNIDREFDAAITSLQRPRQLSFIDHRKADAQAHMTAAEALTVDLLKTLSNKPRGAIEVADLAQEWKALSDHFSALSRLFVVPPTQGASLAQRLGAFDAWAAQRLLQPDIAFFTDELTKDTAHVELLYAAGRGHDAAEAATIVRRRMQRAADAVNTQAQTVRRFVQQSANDLTTDLRIRQRVGTWGVGPGDSAALLKSLDDATALLAAPFNWATRRDVALRIRQARSALLNVVASATLQAARLAAAQAEQSYSMDAVQAVADEGAKLKRGADGKISDPADKTAWLRRLASAWRSRLATLPDPNPPALRAEFDAFEAAIAANNLDAVSAHLSAMFKQMAQYSGARAVAAVQKTTASACLYFRDDIMVDQVAAQQTMGHLDGNSALPKKWERELDGLRRKTNATADTVELMPPDCLRVMVDLSAQAAQLGNDIDSAVWSASVLPDAAKQQLAADFANTLSPQALATFLSDVRPLVVKVTTAVEERYVGRQIEFQVDNLALDWGRDVGVLIDFGDGQSTRTTADELRRSNSVLHAFAGVQRFDIVARASETSGAGAAAAARRTLGLSQSAPLWIGSSPISAARQLSETFFNARFGLALLVAGLLYFWRFHAKKVVFGANAFDYAEAFALGFAVSLAINSLPEKLAKWVEVAG